MFETVEHVQSLYADHNELQFYTWSDRRCCLPKGATRATLKDDTSGGPAAPATWRHLDL